MLKLIDDKKLREKMGYQARINSFAYSSSFFAQRVLSVYKLALKDRPLKGNKSFMSRLKNTVKKGFFRNK